jgi:predicted membrane protein
MKRTNIILGIVLIVIGIILLLKAFGVADINIFFNGWWTLFIIIPAFIGLLTDKDKTGDIIALVIGVLLLLAARGLISFDILWKVFFPAVLILIGLSIIFKDMLSNKVRDEMAENGKISDDSYAATFAGQDINLANQDFSGCTLDAVFGGMKLDLRSADVKDGSIIKCSAIFGGIEILTPDNVNVKIVSSSFFGGISDERKDRANDHKKTLYINGTCLFGGVEIK